MQEFPQKDRPFSPAAKDSIISAVALCLRPKALILFWGKLSKICIGQLLNFTALFIYLFICSLKSNKQIDYLLTFDRVDSVDKNSLIWCNERFPIHGKFKLRRQYHYFYTYFALTKASFSSRKKMRPELTNGSVWNELICKISDEKGLSLLFSATCARWYHTTVVKGSSQMVLICANALLKQRQSRDLNTSKN